MSLSDTFYVALCMTVLILGVVYWFWTQNQYIQRKLNLLENIVYEMKTTLNAQASAPDAVDAVLAANGVGPDIVGPAAAEKYPPPPGSELGMDEDLLHEELHAEAAGAPENAVIEEKSIEELFTTLENDQNDAENDLQPGGVGSGIQDVPSDNSSKAGVLDNMTRAQLKKIAEQRGITVKLNMTKQAMIDAIRAAPAFSPFESHEATVSLN